MKVEYHKQLIFSSLEEKKKLWLYSKLRENFAWFHTPNINSRLIQMSSKSCFQSIYMKTMGKCRPPYEARFLSYPSNSFLPGGGLSMSHLSTRGWLLGIRVVGGRCNQGATPVKGIFWGAGLLCKGCRPLVRVGVQGFWQGARGGDSVS